MRGKKFVIFIFLLLIAVFVPQISQAKDEVVINEVFYDVDSKAGCQTEWIELYNPTDEELSLSGYKIGDEETRGEGEGMYKFPDQAKISSKDFLIIAVNDQLFDQTYDFYPDFKFKVTDGQVNKLEKYTDWASGSFNLANSGDEVLILDPNDNLVDKVDWDTNNKGKSMERSPAGSDNFTISNPPTPGIGLFEPITVDKTEVEGNQVKVYWSLKDKTKIEKTEIYLAYKGEDFEKWTTKTNLSEQPFILNDLDWARDYKLKIKLFKSFSGQVKSSFSRVALFSTNYDLSDQIIINEILPAPASGGEFIELKNNSSRNVNLKGWKLADADKVKTYTIEDDTIIGPGKYLSFDQVLTKISLNNDGDEVNLIYPDSQVSQTIKYAKAKQGKSYSFKNSKFYWTKYITQNSRNKFEKEGGKKNNGRVKRSKIKKVLNKKDETVVKLRGQALVKIPRFGQQMTYIADAGAGIQLYFYHHRWPKFGLGDWLEVLGELSTARGERRVKISQGADIKLIKKGKTKPQALKINKLNKYIGKLVKLSGTVSSSSGSTFYIKKDGIELKIYIKDSTGIDKPETRKGYQAEVVGILVKTNSGYKLLPRKQADLEITPDGVSEGESESSSSSESFTLAGFDKKKANSGRTLGFNLSPSTDYRSNNVAKNVNNSSNNWPGLITIAAFGLGLIGFNYYLYLWRA